VTVLGRGSGATLALALTASTSTRGLFSGVWAAGADAGVLAEVKTIQEASNDYRVSCETLHFKKILDNSYIYDIS